MIQHTVGDLIRMAGHLLLHHPYRGFFAGTRERRDCDWEMKQASCWCLDGALRVCARALVGKKKEAELWGQAKSAVQAMFGLDDVGCVWDLWDNAGDGGRASIAHQMIAYKDSTHV
jgi:hypothetical protein